jgi:CHASE2 domain-containing sensor protein
MIRYLLISFIILLPLQSFQLLETSNFCDEVVLVNIGNLDRSGIAKQLEILAKYKPKVVGIDAFFRKPKHSENPIVDSILVAADSALSRAIRKFPKFVLGAELIEGDDKIIDVGLCHSMFIQKNVSLGFLDLVASEKHHRAVDIYLIHEKIPDSISRSKQVPPIMLSMGAQLAAHYDRQKFNRYLSGLDGKNWDDLDFCGNLGLPDKNNSRSLTSFFALDADHVLNEEFVPELIQGKIVLLGYLGPDFSTYSEEDRFYFYNKHIGQMEEIYGVIIHANACAMMLRK